MRIMKLKTWCVLVGASLFVTPSLFAQIVGTGSLILSAPNYNGAGGNGDQAGPYQVTQLNVSSGQSPVSTTFQTFCIGTEVDYYPGNTFDYQISETVKPNNGSFGNGSVGPPGYVTWGVAYLYSQFLAGNIGVGGNSPTVTTGTAAEQVNDALQAAIWTLQEQQYSGVVQFGGTLNTSLVNQFLNDAATAAANDHISSDTNNANGAFGVYALDITQVGQTGFSQPQLVELPCVPEPSTVVAGVLMLLPLGLSTLRVARNLRKRREVVVSKIQD